MKILHLVKTSTGATWALRQTAEHVLAGIETHMALPGDGPRVKDYIAAGVKVHFAPVDFSLRMTPQLLSQARELRRLTEEIQPDLIHSHTLASTLIMRLALRNSKIPRIFQVPGPLHLEHSVYRRSELGLAQVVDHWIATCKWTENKYLASGIDPRRVFLSYYGLDVARFRENRTGKLRSILGISESTPLAGMVAYAYAPKKWLGQATGLKGHEDFIAGFAIAKKARPDLAGVIIGGPWLKAEQYFEELKRTADQAVGGAIVFLGTRDDVPELYGDIDVVAHPSLSENVGGAAESLLSAVPTIATNVGGFPDVVIPGKTGWLVSPRSPEEISCAILEAVGNREHSRKLALEGQILTKHLFDVRRTAAEVRQLYGQILGDAF